MNLSEITEKIYAEGVEKGNAQAQEIVAQANEKAAAIIAEAEKKAAALLAEAETKSADMDKKTRAELKLYAEQSVNAVKTEMVNLLSDQIVLVKIQQKKLFLLPNQFFPHKPYLLVLLKKLCIMLFYMFLQIYSQYHILLIL